ncbi:MAG: 4-alpha-glucanotransferase [Erythrobacter sp.]|nr:4-alpha-glucanotransferase [Erythrobacter sp.]
MQEPCDPLHQLARVAGVERHWRDVDGVERTVSDESLRAVLAALGQRTTSARQVQASLKALLREQAALPAMVTADAGQPIALPAPCLRAIATADGQALVLAVIDGVAQAPAEPGYYDLEIDGQTTRLAVAPLHCPVPVGRQAGLSLQIPSLRGSRASAYGTFGELAEAAEVLARYGAQALAINPVHALFAGDGTAFSPYSPSSRRFLNGAMADPALAGLPPLPPGDDGGPLIDWGAAIPRHLAQLRATFAALPDGERARLAAEQAGDAALHMHAVFDALDCALRQPGQRGWHHWPARYRDPLSPAVAQFAREQADEVAFHGFVQWLAGKGLAAAHQRAKAAGMATGLVADLAVGVDKRGSDTWSLGAGMLQGLNIGAPPDPLGPLGQDWALTSFSPEGLRASGYAAWIAMIRSQLAHGGGIRIDHAFGLVRLWVIPEGGRCADGAYLAYPFTDLLRLLTLEAHLAGACVIAEDLGTAPHGFTQAVADRRLLPMRVLWFQRAEDHGFIGAADYPAQAVAMTGTHDTPTVAGWWSGVDLDWADRLGRLPPGMDRAEAEAIRDWDRGLLWSTLSGSHPRPVPTDTAPVVEAAIAHTMRTPCAMAITPVEDLLGLTQQPNLPGTIDEHPNWRRRLDAPLDEMLAGRAPLARD